ncbi:ATP-binding cassette domain-containing protein [Acrocarpospora macrocephala]|uniref:Metal-dependent hydrolase n=1 Tax=Acrocarpospora macrocephala TaxID=150177 RepID=A0A5M3X2F4_9ACTN|nr:ATP-binding cassette domain-containing protein [Acrocarpospora macrocephala]GES15294.1 metal-dependent hydrolase [Acrocarpospora macrocephala]
MNSQIQIDVVNACLLAGVLALSINLLLGYTRHISVAHAAFAGVGSYAATWVSIQQGLPFLTCVAIGTGLALVSGVLVGLPSLGLADEFLILLTLCTGALFTGVVTSAPDLGGAYGLLGIEQVTVAGSTLLRPSDWLPYLILAFGCVLAICWYLTRSPYGRRLRAVGDEPTAASALGMPVQLLRLQVFALAAGLAGFAGAISAYYNQVTSPAMWSFNQTLLIIIMVIVGGSGTLAGPCLGAVVITVLPRALQFAGMPPDRAGLYSQIIFAVLLIGMILVRPGGLIRRRPGSRIVSNVFAAAVGLSPSAPRAGALAVRAEGLSKHFGGVAALDGVTIELPRQQISALVGPNGAGKTTLFNALTGFLPVEGGRVFIGATDVTLKSPAYRARLGLVRSFQDVRSFATMSPLDSVTVAVPARRGSDLASGLLRPRATRRAERSSREAARYWLEYVGVDADDLRPTGDLSFAEQKLVALARTLASGAEVLLLDEPLSGVDERWVDTIMDLLERLRADGHTICIVEHSLHVVSRLATQVFFMEAGALTATGTVEELLGRPEFVDSYFGAAS